MNIRMDTPKETPPTPMPEIKPHPQSIEKIDALLAGVKEEKQNRECRKDLMQYVLHCRPDLKPTHLHRVLCNRVMEFLSRPCPSDRPFDAMLVALPFQVGKTTWGAQSLPAWFMGNNPGKDVIIVAYNDDYASANGRENKRKLENFDIFPNCKPGNIWTNNEFTLDRGKGVTNHLKCGAPGTINGQPCHLMVIDDTCKESTEAASDTFCNTLSNNWVSVMASRIKPGGKLLLFQTRWNLRDMHAVIDQFLGYDKVEHLTIPCMAVAENPADDPLGREKGDGPSPEIGKDRKWVQAFAASMIKSGGELFWENCYQGSPTVAAGNIFKRRWIKDYDPNKYNVMHAWNADTDKACQWPLLAVSVDASFKDGEKNDYTAVQIWGKIYEDYYLLRPLKGHWSFVQQVDMISKIIQECKPRYIYIEDKANGPAIIDMLSAQFQGVIPVKPEGGKDSRASAVSYLFSSGHVYASDNVEGTKEWKDSLIAFPNGQHDDDVDATTQFLNRAAMIDATVARVEDIKYTHWTDDMFQDYDNADGELKAFLLKQWGTPDTWLEED